MDFTMDKTKLFRPGGEISNPKETMKQLNERMADFLKHCNNLEKSNIALEKQIEERVRATAPGIPQWTEKLEEAHYLLNAINEVAVENAFTALEIDNQRINLSDLKSRLRQESHNQKQRSMQSKVLETMAIEWRDHITELEFIMKCKEEEKRELILSNQQAVQAVRRLIHPIDNIQFVTVEDGSRMELSQLLNEIRTHYETLISSSQMHLNDLSTSGTQLEEEARKKMEKDEEELREAQASLTEARRQWKNLQVEIDSLQALERHLKHTLQATEQQHEKQLESLSAVIVSLEQELQEVRHGVRTQLQKHRVLLDTNMRLEKEISAYRYLLEKEESRMYGTKYLQERKPSTSKMGFAMPKDKYQFADTKVSNVYKVERNVNKDKYQLADAKVFNSYIKEDERNINTDKYQLVETKVFNDYRKEDERNVHTDKYQLVDTKVFNDYRKEDERNVNTDKYQLVDTKGFNDYRKEDERNVNTDKYQIVDTKVFNDYRKEDERNVNTDKHQLVDTKVFNDYRKEDERNVNTDKYQLADAKVFNSYRKEDERNINTDKYQFANTNVFNGYEERAERNVNTEMTACMQTLRNNHETVSKAQSDFSKNTKNSSGQKCTAANQNVRSKQAIFNGNIAEEGAEASGTVQSEKVDKIIREWEGSFFKDNPKLRKKSVSLRFDLHMAAADEACTETKTGELPDVEVRLVMKRSCSIPSMSP
uniref:IF rod domain-containing protein n=1 Tax=Leptobrachium leishanense TaxID=445787 RepID=A0A8C5WL00_9ANUR